tara:strand:- start:9583 stop:10191 length:609 start_codon:yes stop_codon:yes gene_type:complete
MFEVTEVILWLENNPEWIATAIFLSAFVETFALIGIIVPGVVLLTLISGLASNTSLDIVQVFSIAFIGSLIADILSYFMGKSLSKSIDSIKPFKTNPGLLDRGRAFFGNYGILSIFFGKFIGPIRPLMPITAGTLNMDTSKFLLIDTFGCLMWSLLYTLPGFIAGKAILEQYNNPAFIAAIIASVVISIFVANYLIKRTSKG